MMFYPKTSAAGNLFYERVNPETTTNQSRLHFDEKCGRFLEFASAAELLIFYYFVILNIDISVT